MMDVQVLEQQLKGLVAKGKELRAKEQIFLKAQGLKEQEEICRAAAFDYEADIKKIKEDIKGKKSKRSKLLSDIFSQIRMHMDNILPVGHTVLEVADDNFKFGWSIDNVFRPYKGLSGGEKVSFDMALTKALGAGIVLVEAAELDKKRLHEQLVALDDFDGQVIISTCHTPDEIPEGWEVIQLSD